MRYFVFIGVFSFISLFGFSQSKTKINDPEIFIGFYNKKECKKKLKRAYHLKDSCFYKNTEDELALTFKDTLQTFYMTLKFMDSETKILVDYCNQQEIITDCSTCATQYLERLLHTKSYRWRKTLDNKYLSTYNNHLQFEVDFTSSESVSFIFTYIDMPTKEFKIWYNSLMKPQ